MIHSEFQTLLFYRLSQITYLKATLICGIILDSLKLPRRSLCGPMSLAFQLYEYFEGHNVNPSWCLLVKTTYLQRKNMVKIVSFVGNNKDITLNYLAPDLLNSSAHLLGSNNSAVKSVAKS